jgi:hypothetical protein
MRFLPMICEPILGAENSALLPDVMDFDLLDPKSKCFIDQGGCHGSSECEKRPHLLTWR